jgi:hypothetical protein
MHWCVGRHVKYHDSGGKNRGGVVYGSNTIAGNRDVIQKEGPLIESYCEHGSTAIIKS